MKQKMNFAQIWRTMLLLGLVFLACFASVKAQTNTFTYQGRLTDSQNGGGGGNYLMEFRLFAAASGGSPIEVMTNLLVPVSNNVFTVQLNFTAANAFNGEDRFLEIAVRKTITDPYTTLLPRQPITSTPYSIRSSKATTADNALNVDGTPAAQIIKEGDARLTDMRTPTSGSTNYVQNQNAAAQTSTNFSIDGTGAANIFNAATQYNIGGNRAFTISEGNTFAGFYAGATNTGGDNSYFGREAGVFGATGSANSFFGARAGRGNGGNLNSFFGAVAGLGNGTGSRNVFIGSFAGQTNSSGSNNTALGSSANVGSNALNFATAIGAGAVVSDSNSIVLGRTFDTVRIPGTLNVSTFTADTLSANTVNADTQFNIGGARVFIASATQNTVVGFFTGNGGSGNSIFGYESGKFNTGDLNSFFGNGAGASNLSGSENSFFGRSAGSSNTSGFSNSFFGMRAGNANTTGNDNSFFGWQAGNNNSTGIGNAFFGRNAGFGSNGSNNVFFGLNTGNINRTGSNNTLIGSLTNVGSNALTFATALGAGAVVSSSNTVVLGRTADTVIAPNLLQVDVLGAAGDTSLCRNSLNQISTCTAGNLAEQNKDTAKLDALQRQNAQMLEQLKQQQLLIGELKKLVCANNPTAAVCQ